MTAALHAFTVRALIDYVCPMRLNGFNLDGGKQSNACELRSQVDLLKLKIDNPSYHRRNCLFRALADQLEEDEDDHEKYRRMVVKCLKENPTMFTPFVVEDEVPLINIANPNGNGL
ncbi:OVARIAN TUMOR DOMAIN-containing deubiquitinating enzyme 7-like isoform X2 [Andrographis paniculata]|uniref:OVARIAN TUMOR DOMAIN-containing deubiquitinating enzyme 7-like isoform X2 n=1 Tax=Andrographis paniculata TaxID=175694 RepID=UPI0021E6F3CA|nr:OVARIAN TUMOR DOMAIN-containing deubiquitinating enzyme 7-like isoform X2 [Andrographis paniculata]